MFWGLNIIQLYHQTFDWQWLCQQGKLWYHIYSISKQWLSKIQHSWYWDSGSGQEQQQYIIGNYFELNQQNSIKIFINCFKQGKNISHESSSKDIPFLGKTDVVSKVATWVSNMLKSCNSFRVYILSIVCGEHKISLVACQKYGKIWTK